jgi:hypothetical protein
MTTHATHTTRSNTKQTIDTIHTTRAASWVLCTSSSTTLQDSKQLSSRQAPLGTATTSATAATAATVAVIAATAATAAQCITQSPSRAQKGCILHLPLPGVRWG